MRVGRMSNRWVNDQFESPVPITGLGIGLFAVRLDYGDLFSVSMPAQERYLFRLCISIV